MIDTKRWNRKWLFLLPLPILLAGTFGFRWLEGWPWIDCFYMTVTTVSTVGYGWVEEPDGAGKFFACVLILGGVGTFSFMITLGIQSVVESSVDYDRLARKRVEKMKDHYVICGAGRVGMAIAKTLKERGKPFVAVENDHAIIEELREEGMAYITGDATHEEVLGKAGVGLAKGLACVLESDADNVFICLVAREINPSLFIVARANSESSVSKLIKAGANKVINPFTTTASRMAYTLLKPTVVDFLEIASGERTLDLRMEEILIPNGSALAGCPLGDSELRQKENVIAAAIQKKGGRMVFNPTPTEVIEVGDVLIALGSQESLDALAARIERRL
jgi:voltage-gated potassium channel